MSGLLRGWEKLLHQPLLVGLAGVALLGLRGDEVVEAGEAVGNFPSVFPSCFWLVSVILQVVVFNVKLLVSPVRCKIHSSEGEIPLHAV